MGRLTGCCCCFNLRNGSTAIGITLLVLGSLGLVSTVVATIVTSQNIEPSARSGLAGQAALQIIACVLQLVFNSLLVHGVGKKSRGMVLAWLIYHGIVTGLQSIGMLIAFVIVCISGIWWLILIVLGVSSLIGVFWYWFVVVVHHYQEMQEQNGVVYGGQHNGGEKHAV